MTMLAFILAGAALAPAAQAPAPPSAPPVQVRFTGRTTADATLTRDAVQEVARFSAHALKCDRLTGVEATIMPEGWQPADPNFRIGPPGTIYERWDAAGCGRGVPFLIAFWKPPEGGTMFQVGHPFPADPAKPTKP